VTYDPNAVPDPARGPFAPQPPSAQPTPAEPPTSLPGVDSNGRIERRKVSAVWIGFILAAILLIALVVFIAQNSRTATVNFLWLHGHISLALALLLAAVIGALLVAIPGSVRIVQLRRSLRGAARTLIDRN
jgi:uncharacterized integral membrane protein